MTFTLLILFIMVMVFVLVCLAFGIWLAYVIGESDLPFWVKLWLLSK